MKSINVKKNLMLYLGQLDRKESDEMSMHAVNKEELAPNIGHVNIQFKLFGVKQ